MRKFKTESKKLLDLMINSIYTNREIFLRELVSNASDALDKLHFKSLTDKSVKLGDEELAITLAFDKDARTITITDNGIGMTDAELEKNLGTIAHSDSLEFKMAEDQAAQELADATNKDGSKAKPTKQQEARQSANEAIDIIGQFGVGFYSAFMVASKVRVVSRSYAGEEAWAWESDGVEGYTISPAQRDGHGTDVILTIKPSTADDDYDTFLSEHGLRSLVARYSNYVRYPIRMEVTKSRQLPEPDPKPDDYVPQWEDYTEVETLNSMVPIWKRRKSEVSQDEYNEFYKGQFHDFADPVRTISVHAEGAISYDVLAFVPGQAPWDLYSKDYEKGLQLYSSNVLIMEKCPDLLPDHYNFVRGIVDSQDLSLNISRETLQHNSQLRAIANKVEKKITSELESMRDNDREAYEGFFANFGRGIKYGIYASYGAAASELAPLLLFRSAKHDKMVTLDEYLADAPGDQKAIYYAAGDNAERLAKMPMVAGVLARGYDVLLCTQDVDEFCLTAMHSYAVRNDAEGDDAESREPLELRNVASGDLGLDTEADKTAKEAAEKANEPLFAAMREALGEKVSKVTVSTLLGDAPAAITTEGPISLEMERVLSSMPDASDEFRTQRVLELNAQHPVFTALGAAQEAGDTDKVARYAKLLYDQALLVEGLPIDDPVAFASSIADLMV